jgi:hypothetical protein
LWHKRLLKCFFQIPQYFLHNEFPVNFSYNRCPKCFLSAQEVVMFSSLVYCLVPHICGSPAYWPIFSPSTP